MKILNLNISKKETLRFSKITKDRNPIHVSKQAGSSSIFRENISHGVLLVLKILSKIKNISHLFSSEYLIRITFIKPIFFDERILVKYQHNFSAYNFRAIQNKQKICNIEVEYRSLENKEIKIGRFKKNQKLFFLEVKKNLVYKFKNELKNLQDLLCSISYYVGMIKPGKRGILNSIEIHKFNKFKDKFSKILINTKKMDSRYNLYENELYYKKYKGRFLSSVRQEYKIESYKNNFKTNKIINKINKDIIVISGSSGLGESFLNLIKYNKKIKIISTYSTKKPKKKLGKNIFFKKIKLPKDFSKLKKIIKKLNYPYIFYFVSPPINFSNNLSIKNRILYKKLFVEIPLKILKFSNKKISKFIYPSTTNIDYNIDSIYSKIKISAENKLKKFKKCFVHRFEKLYSKNTISIHNSKIINLQKLLNKNSELLYSFFK